MVHRMPRTFFLPAVYPLLMALMVSMLASTQAASFLEKLGLKKTGKAGALVELTEEQMVSGLREALAKGVEHAVSQLGKTDGFFKDVAVFIPVPESLQKVERGLRVAGQGALVDDFLLTMNRAAEKAVPAAASVLADSVRSLSIAEAKSILNSTNSAATDYFRRTSETALRERFLPIVKSATETAGVTGAYKKMLGRVEGTGSGVLGGLAAGLLKKDMLDVDAYVTGKAMEGLFHKIAEQEKALRENPAARGTDLLRKVFGSLKP